MWCMCVDQYGYICSCVVCAYMYACAIDHKCAKLLAKQDILFVLLGYSPIKTYLYLYCDIYSSLCASLIANQDNPSWLDEQCF